MTPPPLILLLAAAATATAARAEPQARPPGTDDARPRVQFHEHLVEGWRSSPPQLDLADAAAVFRLVFSQLPAEVDVVELGAQLAAVGRELGVEVRLRQSEPDVL